MRPSDASNYADRTVKSITPKSGISKANGGTANGGATDNFQIGDRVIVSNTKHGCIQFLGTTQFAAGEWAGVVLDDILGKNDGSVKGIRYFQCEAKRGVFARPDKLVREPSSSTPKAGAGAAPNAAQISRPSGLPGAPRMGTRVGSPRGSNTKMPNSSSKEALQRKVSSSTTEGDGGQEINTGLKVRLGCCVCNNGNHWG